MMDRVGPMELNRGYNSNGLFYGRSDVTWSDNERKRYQEEMRMASKFKTSLCTEFRNIGICSYGESCRFAHGEEELRPKQAPKNIKTVLCRNFERDGCCPYAGRCLFVHRKKADSVHFDNMSVANITPLRRSLPVLPGLSLGRVNPMAVSHVFDRASVYANPPHLQRPLRAHVDEIRAKISSVTSNPKK